MKNQKGFIVPILIAIIAVLIIGGVAYFYQNKKVEAPIININSNVPTSTKSTVVTNLNSNLVSVGSSGDVLESSPLKNIPCPGCNFPTYFCKTTNQVAEVIKIDKFKSKINCGSNYWTLISTDSGYNLYGPF